MTMTKDTTNGLHDAELDTALAAIEVARLTPAGEDAAWQVNTNVDFWTLVGPPSAPPNDGGYTRAFEQYNVQLGSNGWLLFTAHHGEHVDSITLAPAEVHALYRFYSLIVLYRLGLMKAEEASAREAYIAAAVVDPEVRKRIRQEWIVELASWMGRLTGELLDG